MSGFTFIAQSAFLDTGIKIKTHWTLATWSTFFTNMFLEYSSQWLRTWHAGWKGLLVLISHLRQRNITFACFRVYICITVPGSFSVQLGLGSCQLSSRKVGRRIFSVIFLEPSKVSSASVCCWLCPVAAVAPCFTENRFGGGWSPVSLAICIIGSSRKF